MSNNIPTERRCPYDYSAVEASLTGHTVVSTVHAFAADSAHMRIALLCQKRFPINFNTSLMQAGQAFPIVVYSMKNTLWKHLHEIDSQANEMFEKLTKEMALQQGVTEELKAQNQMLWVQKMTNIQNSATEIVLSELIYS